MCLYATQTLRNILSTRLLVSDFGDGMLSFALS